MTKRTVVYLFSAVLLGVAIMITPLWIIWTFYIPHAPEEGTPRVFLDALYHEGASSEKWEFPQKDSYQVNHEPAAYEGVGIFAIGFIVALAARFIVKRRAPYPRHQFPPV